MLKSIQQSLILALCVFSPILSMGATLSEEEAKNVAVEFFQAGDVDRLAHRDALTLSFVARDSRSNPVSYVFNANDGKGFVIISADTDALPVVGYSYTTTWEPGSGPVVAKEFISTPVALFKADGRGVLRTARAGEQRSKLLETPSWSQETPFNFNIPNRRLTGCVGVALAEIMKYHNYPSARPASLVKLGEVNSYSWNLMRNDNYRNGYDLAEADAVATLVADAAIGIGTDFGMSSSSAFEVKVPYALTSLFGYDAGVSYKKRSELDKASWDALIVNEINEGRPVLYSGQDVSSGHAFVCDGYEMQGTTPYFHINWGWGGSANGYYASDALNPVVSKAHSYNDLMTVIYNIKPAAAAGEWSPLHVTSDECQVGLSLDTDDITSVTGFTVRVGSIKNISNTDFSGKLAVALFDAGGKQKCLLSDARNFNLVALQTFKYLDFNCSLPSGTTVGNGDVVRMVSMNNGGSWLPIAGDNILAPGEMAAKGAALSYFNVKVPATAEAVEIAGGEGRVIKGRDYSFKVVPTAVDKVVTVKANGFILTPDASHNYVLTNVLSDQEITINVQNAADVLTKSVLWVEAGKLKELLNDNETATIKDLTLFGTINAEDFSFIRERMKLNRLDLSQVSIAASGSNPANAIPTKALTGYRSLQTIILPQNLSTFKNGCLAQTGLRSIDIPASVSTFEYNVFVGCSSLREVIYRRSAPAWVNWCVFSGVPQDKLIVPVGATAAYKAKEYWQDFKEILEGVPEPASTFTVTVAEKKGLKFTPLTEGAEFGKGAPYEFRFETDNSFEDATMKVYANSGILTPDASGTYRTTINGNTLIHVEFNRPQPTTPDKTWKLTGDAGGLGLVTQIVNVPFNKTFVVRANAIKIPKGDDAAKFYGIALTDKDGSIKEFISQIVSNYYSRTGETVNYNFYCQVREANVREGNQLRLVTSYDKKNWQFVEGEDSSITDRLEAIGNPVIYHNVTIPENVTGARIEGASSQIVRGMPFSVKVSAINPAQRVTVSVNGETKATNVSVANVSIPAVLQDLDVTISVKDAAAGDYMVFNIQEGQLATKLAECPERVKLIGTMLVSDFDAIRAHAAEIIDLDMTDVTIKGAAMTGNSIPENAFAPTSSSSLCALKTIILPNSIERISNNAFGRCTQITEITIPANVNYIGNGAFSACVGLKKIVAKPKVAPTCGNLNPFPSGAGNIVLEVPKGSEESYSVPSTWWPLLKLYQAPTEQKDYYWVKVDQSRVLVDGYKGNLNNVAVGSDDLDIKLLLPNYQQPSQKNNSYIREGVPFKLYDNGVDVFANVSKYHYEPQAYYRIWPEQNVNMTGGALALRWVHSATSGCWMPQNHELEIWFYYSINFENKEGAENVEAQIVEVPEGCEWRNVPMTYFKYFVKNAAGYNVANTEVKPVLYREGSQIMFRLSDPGPKTDLVVRLKSKVMTKSGKTPVFEEREMTLESENGIYTIPSLDGDTWISISGITRYEEGDPIPADDLGSLKKEEVLTFSEVAVTGEMNEEDFQTIRDKFEGVETIDLSQIENEVIPENAFEGMENLRNVIVPETVTEIGEGAFRNCENIETLTLPGVNSIGEGAFDGCSNLKSILIPSSDAVTQPTPAEAPAKRIRRKGVTRAGNGITVESFRGLNPNCLIYMGANDIPDSESLNIILNQNGTRVAASDIRLDGNHSFNAPASFNLGKHRISFTVEIPGSIGSDDNDGWKGIMLPFTPTGMEYGVEFANRELSGLTLMSFSDENAETMSVCNKIEANRPYMANVAAPFAVVPVTFYADGGNKNADSTFDVPYTPVPEETAAVGKNFSLFGTYDGETVFGTCYTLNETADSFIRPAEGEEVAIGSFSAYLRANSDVETSDFVIGEHPLWICDPEASGNGNKLYRNNRIEIASATANASIYYTTDNSDPTVSPTRKLYESPINMESEEMDIKAVTEYKGRFSDVSSLHFELKTMNLELALANNWNWISHNMESPVKISDFVKDGISRILSQEEESVVDPVYGLVGSLKELKPSVAYKVCVSADSWNGKVTGVAYDPAIPMTLHRGWNWIGTLVEDASLAIPDLLSNLDAEVGEMIVGLEGFAVLDNEGSWIGTLRNMVPGAGYLYLSHSDKEFSYSVVPASEEVEAPAHAAEVETPWVVDIHRYSSVMPVTAVLTDASADEYVVGAFCGDECRGIGVNINGTIMINVHGERGDAISFRFMSDNQQLRSNSSLGFNEQPVGSLDHPYELNTGGATVVEVIENADDYVIMAEDGTLIFTGDMSSVLSVEVYDVEGHKLAESGKGATASIRISDLEEGVCLVLIRTKDSCIYRKIMVK